MKGDFLLKKRLREQERRFLGELYEVEQALGRVLGYPRAGPEIGGDGTTFVVGEATPASLAEQAARKISALEAALEVRREHRLAAEAAQLELRRLRRLAREALEDPEAGNTWSLIPCWRKVLEEIARGDQDSPASA